MKKIIQLGSLAILTALLIFFFVSRNKSTIKQELRDFTVQDTSVIDKIFLVDKASNSVLLERKSNYWQINDQFEARADLVNLLLKTLNLMRIKEPVSNAASETIIKNLAVKSIKVELYSNNKLKKVFYVGGPTQDSYGTYMIMENSTTPFVLEIPGFRGYLSTRFSTNLTEWKTQRVFNYAYNEVSEVILENHLDANESFLLKKEGAEFLIYSYPEIDRKILADTISAKTYIANLRNKNFSKYIDDVPMEWQDSIKASSPMYTLTIIDIDNNERWFKAYNKPGWGRLDAFGDPLDKDPDNFFMLMDNDDFVYAQYYVFEPLLKDLKHFTN